MYEFSPISSAVPGGERNVSFDLSHALGDDEILTAAVVTSSDPSIIAVSDDGISDDNQGAAWHIHAVSEIEEQYVYLDVTFVGDEGSADTYRIRILVVDQIDGSECC